MCTPAIGSIPVAFKFSFSFSIFHSFSSSLLSSLSRVAFLLSPFLLLPVRRPESYFPAIFPAACNSPSPSELNQSFQFEAVAILYDSLITLLIFFSFFFFSYCVCVCVCVVFDVSLKLVWLQLQRYWSREREDGKSKRCLSKEYFRRRRGEPRNQGRLENQFRLPDLCLFLLEFFLIHFISLSLTLGCSYLPPLY